MSAKKVLLALDDSRNAMRAVEFTAGSFSRDHSITLFSVIPNTAAICGMNSPSLTPYFMAQQGTFCALEDKKKELITEVQKKAKDMLLGAGFDEKKIAVKLEAEGKGVARAIINEAHSGYDLLIMGRRGLSGIKEFFLGSVSSKVFCSLRDVSVLVVD